MKMCAIECWSCRNPGTVSSRVTTPPPNQAFRSRTRIRLPAAARYAAATRPLCPEPTTTTSFLFMAATYQIYAIRYAHLEHTARHNFVGGDEQDCPMPLDYYVWAIVNAERTVLVDTGFDQETAQRRGRQIVRPVADGLAAIGSSPDRIEHIVISHMHYDHAGNHELFPHARYHVQTEEMAFCTGSAMCHVMMRSPYAAPDVQAMVGKLYAGRVVYHDGVAELAP